MIFVNITSTTPTLQHLSLIISSYLDRKGIVVTDAVISDATQRLNQIVESKRKSFEKAADYNLKGCIRSDGLLLVSPEVGDLIVEFHYKVS